MDSAWEMEIMRVMMSPQVRFDEKRIVYSFNGEIITASIGDAQDTFDFSALPDGEVNWSMINTTLEFNPIIKAERLNGILSVELINFISGSASKKERFPQWTEV